MLNNVSGRRIVIVNAKETKGAIKDRQSRETMIEVLKNY